MGLFSKQETREDPRLAIEPEDDFYDQTYSEAPQLAPLPAQTNTVIAQGVLVNGTLHGEGVVQIEGTLEGEIRLDGSVIVTTTGRVTGPITANLVRVAGYVKGNIKSSGHLRLEQTGCIEGDVSTPSLVVEDGGRFDGRSTMIKADQKEEVQEVAQPPVQAEEKTAGDPLLEEE
ncbi:MAG: polymer-forming cytoskeletal protein [Lawsonibacter sp.]|nr:polymer-forming cytoskeletal protein [Lawsonibacter sp.]